MHPGVEPTVPVCQTAPERSPVPALAIGLAVAVAIIVGFSLYAAREIGTLRGEQAALSERNRLGTLQIVRIQQSLSSSGGAAARRARGHGALPPEPLVQHVCPSAQRLGTGAGPGARELAPVVRLCGEQAQLDEANRRFWDAMARAFTVATQGAGSPAVRAERSRRRRRRYPKERARQRPDPRGARRGALPQVNCGDDATNAAVETARPDVDPAEVS